MHPQLQVPGCPGQQQVHPGPVGPFQVAAGQPVVALQVTDNGFDGRSLAEPAPQPALLVVVIAGFKAIRMPHLHAQHFGKASIAAVHDGLFRQAVGQGPVLPEDGLQGLGIMGIAFGHGGSHDHL